MRKETKPVKEAQSFLETLLGRFMLESLEENLLGWCVDACPGVNFLSSAMEEIYNRITVALKEVPPTTPGVTRIVKSFPSPHSARSAVIRQGKLLPEWNSILMDLSSTIIEGKREMIAAFMRAGIKMRLNKKIVPEKF